MTEKDESNPHGVKVGQVWRDMDKRGPVRYLRVAEVLLAEGKARVVPCNSSGGQMWDRRYQTRPIKLTRFVKGSSGYELMKDVTE